MEKKIELHLQGLTSSQIQSGAYALVLMENGKDIFRLWSDGRSTIHSHRIEGVSTPRPLTHDLIVSMANKLELKLKQISSTNSKTAFSFPNYGSLKEARPSRSTRVRRRHRRCPLE